MATLQFAIDARGAADGARQFHAASEQIKADASNIESKVSALQQRISQGFKFASWDQRSFSQLKSQFETAGDLQDRLFNATHSGLEVALKQHDDYFANLRVNWQKNESMLTLISKTETAERKNILKQYASESGNFIHKNLGSIMRMGAITYLTNSLMDMGTNMLKAQRHGESMFEAFLAGLPIINRMAKSAALLADELSGVAEASEVLAATKGLTKGIGDIQEDMGRSIQLQRASTDAEKERLQTLFRYQDRLKGIDEAEKEHNKTLEERNQKIRDQIEAVKKLPSAQKFAPGGFGSMGVVPPGITEAERQRRIQELENKIIGYETVGEGARQVAKREYEGALAGGKEDEEWQRSVVKQTQQAMESVRHQDYLTRMERIESLKIYQSENAATLSQVEEANRALNQEIQSLERSRVDAMKVYQRELREDFEDFALYRSEKEAEVAREIEGSMSNAFQSMITQGASFRDAMSQFFTDVGASFSRMASDMLARAVMMKIMGVFMGSAGQLGGDGSSVNIAGSSFENPGAVFGAPVGNRFGNVFDRGRLVPMASGAVLDGPTYFPLAGGKVGLAGEAGPELGFVPLRRQGGRLGLDSPAPQPVQVTVRPPKVIIVKNEKEAALEAMRGDEGDAVIINSLAKHGLL